MTFDDRKLRNDHLDGGKLEIERVILCLSWIIAVSFDTYLRRQNIIKEGTKFTRSIAYYLHKGQFNPDKIWLIHATVKAL